MRTVFERTIEGSRDGTVELTGTIQSDEIPEIVAALNQRPDITTLDLDDNCIRPKETSYKLLELKYVRRLVLKRNFIDDAFAKALVEHPNFEELDLDNNAFTDAGIAALIPSVHQTELKMKCMHVRRVTMDLLSAKLEENRQKAKLKAEAETYSKAKAEFDVSFSGVAQTVLSDRCFSALRAIGFLAAPPLPPKCQEPAPALSRQVAHELTV